MKNKYNQVMERVKIDDEMRERILKNIDDQLTEKHGSNKRGTILKWRKVSMIAAAAVILLIGSMVYTRISRMTDASSEMAAEMTEDTMDNEMTALGPEEMASLEELQAVVGYEVEELTNLPFEVEEVYYLSYDGTDAEIQYVGADNRIIYSKLTEIGENNGHYETYEEEKTVDAAGYSVILKGNEGEYQLAVWDDGTYGYMIYSEIPLEENILLEMIS